MRAARFIALAVLALWGLASVHCKLEAFPQLAFLKTCCAAEPLHQPHSASPSDCEDDACGAVEEGGYRNDLQGVTVVPPELTAFAQVLWRVVLQAPEPRPSALPEYSPPQPSRTWQFAQRTALPPRAPSSVS